jgi:probable rRNA maturation factor
VIALTVDADARNALTPKELVRFRAHVARMVTAAAADEAADDLEVSLRLCTDATIHALNRGYRNIDRPTDVLAFAQRDANGPAHTHHILGDIVISTETAARQAPAHNKTLYDELLHLTAHGLCHLLGHDHQTDAQEAKMNARMAELLGT